MQAAAVVLAGGRGTRLGGEAGGNKVYLPLAGRRLISWSLNTFLRCPEVDRVVLVIREDEHDLAAAILGREVHGRVELVTGGDTRHGSEWGALQLLAGDIENGRIDVVAIHDGARPLVSGRQMSEVIAAARVYGAALPGLPIDDVVARTDGDRPLAGLVRVQTPQAFRADAVLQAYRLADVDGFVGTDTSACIERYAELSVHCLPGDIGNLKVTYARDLFIAERLLADARFRGR